jgi:hypothetical protein
MYNQTDDFNLKVGRAIADSITEEWEKAWLIVTIKPDVISTQGFYQIQGDKTTRSFTVNFPLVKLFRDLHNKMAQVPNRDWKTANFEVMRDGTFQLTFEY